MRLLHCSPCAYCSSMCSLRACGPLTLVLTTCLRSSYVGAYYVRALLLLWAGSTLPLTLTVCRLYAAMPPSLKAPTPNPNPRLYDAMPPSLKALTPNPNPRLYDAMPPSLKAPWDASKSEVRCLGLADPNPNPNPNPKQVRGALLRLS